MQRSSMALTIAGISTLAIVAACADSDGDAPPGASSNDGGAAADGRTSSEGGGSFEGDAGAKTWCSTRVPKPAFCADFDAVTAVASGWDNGTAAVVQGSVDLFAPGGDAGFSAPNVARMALDPVTSSGAQRLSSATLLKSVTGTTQSVAVTEFRAVLPSAAPTPDGAVKYVTVSLDTRGVGLFRRYDGVWYVLAFDQDGESGALPVSSSPPTNVWTSVRLAVNFDSGRVELEFDGQSAFDAVRSELTSSPFRGGAFKLGLGLGHESGQTPALEMLADDVTFTVR